MTSSTLPTPSWMAFTCWGEVGTPRLVPYDQDMSVTEVVARAGGFTQNAQRTRILVVRSGLSKPIEVDLEALLLGDPAQKDIQLQGNDIVFIPEQGLSEYSRYARLPAGFRQSRADRIQGAGAGHMAQASALR